MPAHEALPRFTTDLEYLTPEQRRRFRQAVTASSTTCTPMDASARAFAKHLGGFLCTDEPA
ncbi:hypothetical protein [Streptomyces liliiviolaceus]|uniref:hypothetical protein n=1 Tax=Streptomyces liliiviolaceus TaxID=2823109 RepID=UPI001FFD9FB9|nr:hypothetical protein [Streptomyces liliiviolaceus]